MEDLEVGTLKTSWALEKRHRAVSQELQIDLATQVTIGILLSSGKGAWDVSNELNELFPDYPFSGIEEFLTKVWIGKP